MQKKKKKNRSFTLFRNFIFQLHTLVMENKRAENHGRLKQNKSSFRYQKWVNFYRQTLLIQKFYDLYITNLKNRILNHVNFLFKTKTEVKIS